MYVLVVCLRSPVPSCCLQGMGKTAEMIALSLYQRPTWAQRKDGLLAELRQTLEATNDDPVPLFSKVHRCPAFSIVTFLTSVVDFPSCCTPILFHPTSIVLHLVLLSLFCSCLSFTVLDFSPVLRWWRLLPPPPRLPNRTAASPCPRSTPHSSFARCPYLRSGETRSCACARLAR